MAQATLGELDASEVFDCILYIDVMEHLEDDRAEAAAAAARLAPGGVLIILSPAHQWLFNPFDATVGHFRRYNRRSLARIVPASLEVVSLSYLDSVGLLLSLGNRLVLRSVQPTEAQINLWDRRVIPLSRLTDRVFGYRAGKTIVGIWRRPG